MNFSKDIFLRFNHGDYAGIGFFSIVFQMYHELLEDYLNQSLISWNKWFQNENFLVPIKHCKADYFQPLQVGSLYTAHLHIKQLSKTSVSFRAEIKQKNTSFCTVESVHVFVDKKTNRKTLIPNYIRDILYQDFKNDI